MQHDRTLAEAGAENKKLVESLENFAKQVQESIQKTQTEVNHTQHAIQTLIDSTRADGTSTVLRSGSGGERDRSVFDPRDYKMDSLPSQFALGVWKKWRHGVEIYIDTVGPSWRGVKLLLQQARHSTTPLEPDRESMSGIIERAAKANKGQPPVDPLFDFTTKAVTLYQMLWPQLNLNLSTEFRYSAPDNGFETLEASQQEAGPSTSRPGLPPYQRLAQTRSHKLRRLRPDSPVHLNA